MSMPGPRGRTAPAIDDYSGGLNTSTNPQNVSINSSPRCFNVYSQSKSKRLFKRRGYENLTTSPAAELQGNSALDFAPSLTSGRKIISHFGTFVYKMDDQDGVLDQIGTGFANVRSQMVQYTASSIEYVVIADGVRPLHSWNGIDATTTQIASAPISRLPFVFRDALFCADNQGEPVGKVLYTNDNSFTFGTNSFTIPGATEAATGWGELKRQAYLFFPHSIVQISFLGGSPRYSVQTVVRGIGTISPDTIENIVFNGQEYIVFLGSDKKFYLFDGFNIIPISQNIDEDNGISEYAMVLMNDQIYKAHSFKDTKQQWYITFFGNGQATEPNVCWIMDYSGDRLTFWPFDNQNFHNSTVTTNGLKQERLIVLGRDGHIYFWHRSKNDDGTAIDAEWTTHRLFPGSGQTVVKGGKVKLYPDRRGNANLKFYYRTNLNTEWGDSKDVRLYTDGDVFLGSTFILGSSKLGSPNTPTTELDIDNQFSHIEFRLVDEGINFEPWSFNKMEFFGFALGAGRSLEEGNARFDQ